MGFKYLVYKGIYCYFYNLLKKGVINEKDLPAKQQEEEEQAWL
jgi:hypothetical protein